MIVKLHHIEILCNNLQHRLRQFCGKFGFRPFAESSRTNQVALKRSRVQFVLTGGKVVRDTVANIALEVKDVESATSHVVQNGGTILNEPEIHQDSYGSVVASVIQSPCGNVVHTLLDTSKYHGVFIPGFQVLLESQLQKLNCSMPPNFNEGLLSHLDHIAFACNQGSTPEIIDWYKRCLGFERFCLNSKEKEDGFTIQSSVNSKSVGLKLAAMKYWKCSQTSITTDPNGLHDDGVKFVLAESLPEQGTNQIQTFLKEHGGPGVQHIGFHTTDMVQAIQEWRDAGVEMIAPPQEYYEQPEKIHEIESAGYSVKSLMDGGILLDAESFSSHNNRNSPMYLMQVFTQPIFDEDTFFLEVIQRCGATGFGAGNIKALWKALDTHMKNLHINCDNTKNVLRY